MLQEYKENKNAYGTQLFPHIKQITEWASLVAC
jgi:hypothetical protein